MQETTKPSTVIYAVLVLIATAAVNFVRLIVGSLWFIGNRIVRLVTSPDTVSEPDTENT